MNRQWGTTAAAAVALAAAVLVGHAQSEQQQEGSRPNGDAFRFRTGVELINVTATVTDSNGRFVPDLRQADFAVYEDEQPQTITHFNAERVPVSLGIVLDTSGSMLGEKFDHAQDALDRFLYDLLDPADEVFLYRFSDDPILVEGWTTDRDHISRALRRITPKGRTAMYDAVAEAIPLAQRGRNRKKALVVISDGNDTNSQAHIDEVKHMIRETEVLVYAIGIDGRAEEVTGGWRRPPPSRPPIQIPWPFPGGRRPPWPQRPMGGRIYGQQDDRVDVLALREMTDDSGGRTEIVRSSRDLQPATASIADELSRQYFLAYPAAARKDGRWHSIRVEVRNERYHVRARRGYVAS
jgi:Ca-activated chloride channel homolog